MFYVSNNDIYDAKLDPVTNTYRKCEVTVSSEGAVTITKTLSDGVTEKPVPRMVCSIAEVTAMFGATPTPKPQKTPKKTQLTMPDAE